MFKHQIRLGAVLGIPLHIDSSWLLILLWSLWSLAGRQLPSLYPGWSAASYWIVGLLISVLFFSSVLLHELGHALVARAHGIPVRDITLYIFGGMAEIAREPDTPWREYVVAIAGPTVNLALAGLFGWVYWLARAAAPQLAALGHYVGLTNLLLGVINLVPGYPLDGGRVLRAALWGVKRDLVWASRWTARVGQVVAYFCIVGGVAVAVQGRWFSGLSVAFMGVFIDNAARSTHYQLSLRRLLEGHTVAEVMDDTRDLLPPQLTLDLAVDHHFLTSARRCYAVGNHSGVWGLVTLHNVRDVPRQDWPFTHLSDVMTPLDKLLAVAPTTPLEEALRMMTGEGVNQLPVLVDGAMVGMLTRARVLTFIRIRSELGV